MPRRDDGALLRDMLAAARAAVAAIEGRELAELRSDHIRMLGLVKCIEIVGEAAGQLSEDFRRTHETIPWPLMIGMRHRLVHAYFEIDEDQIWKTLTGDLPPLIEKIENMLRDEFGGVL